MKPISAKRAFEALETNREELVAMQAKLKKVEADIEQLEYEIRLGEDVSFFHKGVAISHNPSNWETWRGVEEPYAIRRGVIYPNAHEDGKGRYGAHLHSGWPMRGNHVETWLGAYWSDREELKQIVLNWIVTGKLPEKRVYKP